MAQKKNSLNPEQQKLLVLGVLIAGVALTVYFMYIVQPLRTKSASLASQLTAAKTEAQQLDSVVGRLQNFQTEHQRLMEATAMWRDRMPREDQLPVVIERLSDYASATGAKILIIMPMLVEDSRAPKKGGRGSSKAADSEVKEAYKKIPLQVDAQGSYHALGKFINQIEQARNPMNVLSLRVSGSKDGYEHRIQLVVETYFGTDGK